MAVHKAKINTRAHSKLERSSPSFSHYRNSKISFDVDLSPVFHVADRAMEMVLATGLYKEKEAFSQEEIEWGISSENLKTTTLERLCPVPPKCPPNAPIYRHIDGSCNNKHRPDAGMPLTTYTRLLPASYGDGVYTPRVSKHEGKPLPSARAVSSSIFEDHDNPNYNFTMMVMQFGQFLTHDITHGIDNRHENGEAISCCLKEGSGEIPVDDRHPACMPIEIPKEDPFYWYFEQRCMNFVRSVIAPRHDCTLGYAEQMNKVTHYLDGSVIYGSNPAETNKLRSHHGGKLKIFDDFGRDLLPTDAESDACVGSDDGSACFFAGDTRVNQMIALVAVHLLFHREHNRVAEELAYLNSDWDDEKLFLEARRIVIAEFQVITYKEFLPAVIGHESMEEFGLYLQEGLSYSYDYDHKVDVSISNEFASAAFRYGHSIVEGYLKIYGMKRMSEIIDLPEIMFNPSRMRKVEFFDQILSTLTTEPIQEVDNSISESLSRYMFKGGNPFGVDLASINIQRGRDHGMRPYNDYRQLVGLDRIYAFEEFGPVLGRKLKRLYASVDDIDLWVGGLLEPKYSGGLVGTTFKDIIGDQFSRLRKGDRFFFEHSPKNNPEAFTPEQLQELRKASMSRLICDNSDRIYLNNQALNAFRKPGVPGNEFADCSGPVIPRINLQYWKD
ncbi:chorion peroxidase isoform X2 [Agrilus planipennis]|nr:chorion peroxidase isoform X2 [Agrilus planipennis]